MNDLSRCECKDYHGENTNCPDFTLTQTIIDDLQELYGDTKHESVRQLISLCVDLCYRVRRLERESE